jgi:hypothetical protein
MKLTTRSAIGTSDRAAACCRFAQLQTKFAIKAMGALVIDLPALPPEEHMDASIPVENTGRSQLLNPHPEAGLIEAASPDDHDHRLTASAPPRVATAQPARRITKR